MGRHAFLIAAHGNPEILYRLIRLLDDPENDLYLHLDAKWTAAGAEDFRPQRAGFFPVPRIRVNWGGFSQIECELRLLSAAMTQPHDYLHYISGVDLPLLPQGKFRDFFRQHAGQEFVSVSSSAPFRRRAGVYRPFQEAAGKSRAAQALDKAAVALQLAVGIDRLKKCPVPLGYGSCWFSITEDFARYVLDHADWVRTQFRSTSCCDEVFLQSLLLSSPFSDRVHRPEANVPGNLRYVDWKGGNGKNPKILATGDWEKIRASGCLFARKFDWNTDSAIVEDLVSAVKSDE